MHMLTHDVLQVSPPVRDENTQVLVRLQVRTDVSTLTGSATYIVQRAGDWQHRLKNIVKLRARMVRQACEGDMVAAEHIRTELAAEVHSHSALQRDALVVAADLPSEVAQAMKEELQKRAEVELGGDPDAAMAEELEVMISASINGGRDFSDAASFPVSTLDISTHLASTNRRREEDKRRRRTPPCEVRLAEPNFGTVAGGTKISLRGSGFVNSPKLCVSISDTIGRRQVHPATFVSAERITFVLPRVANIVGLVLLEVSLNGERFTDCRVPFVYVAEPRLLAVHREHGLVPRLSLRGRNLLVHPGQTRVWFHVEGASHKARGAVTSSASETASAEKDATRDGVFSVVVDLTKDTMEATSRADDLEEFIRVLNQDPALHHAPHSEREQDVYDLSMYFAAKGKEVLEFLGQSGASELSVPIPTEVVEAATSDSTVSSVLATVSLAGPEEESVLGDGTMPGSTIASMSNSRCDVQCGPVYGGTRMRVSLPAQGLSSSADTEPSTPVLLLWSRDTKKAVAVKEAEQPVTVSDSMVRTYVTPELPSPGVYTLWLVPDDLVPSATRLLPSLPHEAQQLRGEEFCAYHSPIGYLASPAASAMHGGSLIALHGSGFQDTGDIRVRIHPHLELFPLSGGDVTVHGVFVSTHEIRFIAPAVPSPFRAELLVSLNGGRDFSSLELEYEAYQTPDIKRLEPGAGPMGGGTVITVFTSNMELAAASDVEPLVRFTGVFSAEALGTTEGKANESSSAPGLTAPQHTHHSMKVVKGTIGGRSVVEAVADLERELERITSQRQHESDAVVAGVLHSQEASVRDRIRAVRARMRSQFPGEVVVVMPDMTTRDGSHPTHAFISISLDNGQTFDPPVVPPEQIHTRLAEVIQGGTSRGNAFSFYTAPIITALDTSVAPVDGGVVVTGQGTGLVQGVGTAAVPRVGLLNARTGKVVLSVPAKLLRDGVISFVTPKFDDEKSGIYTVVACVNGQDMGVSGARLALYRIKSVLMVPSCGAVEGGTVVTLSGEGLVASDCAQVRLTPLHDKTRQTVTRALCHDNDDGGPTFEFTMPAGEGPVMQVALAIDGTTFVEVGAYKFFARPALGSMQPDKVVVGHGVRMLVSATDIPEAAQNVCIMRLLVPARDVKGGSSMALSQSDEEDETKLVVISQANATVNTESGELAAMLPPTALHDTCVKSEAVLQVSLNGGHDWLPDNLPIELVRSHHLSSVLPTNGPVIGNTEITITGTNFRPGNVVVHFRGDGVEASAPAEVVDRTTIKCVTPALAAAQRVSISVDIDSCSQGEPGTGGKTPDTTLQFSFFPVPVLRSISVSHTRVDSPTKLTFHIDEIQDASAEVVLRFSDAKDSSKELALVPGTLVNVEEANLTRNKFNSASMRLQQKVDTLRSRREGADLSAAIARQIQDGQRETQEKVTALLSDLSKVQCVLPVLDTGILMRVQVSLNGGATFQPPLQSTVETNSSAVAMPSTPTAATPLELYGYLPLEAVDVTPRLVQEDRPVEVAITGNFPAINEPHPVVSVEVNAGGDEEDSEHWLQLATSLWCVASSGVVRARLPGVPHGEYRLIVSVAGEDPVAVPEALHVLEPLHMSSIYPDVIPATGYEDPIIITGHGFKSLPDVRGSESKSSGIMVRLLDNDGNEVGQYHATAVDNTTATFPVPIVDPTQPLPAPLRVQVAFNPQHWIGGFHKHGESVSANLPLALRVFRAESVSPSTVFMRGGTQLRINGAFEVFGELDIVPHVRFSFAAPEEGGSRVGLVVKGEFLRDGVTPGTIAVTSPRFPPSIQHVSVEISARGKWFGCPQDLLVTSPPTVTRLHPSWMFAGCGEPLSIMVAGANALLAMESQDGEVWVRYTPSMSQYESQAVTLKGQVVNAAGMLTCAVPSAPVDEACPMFFVEVSFNGQDFTDSGQRFHLVGMHPLVPDVLPLGTVSNLSVRGFGFAFHIDQCELEIAGQTECVAVARYAVRDLNGDGVVDEEDQIEVGGTTTDGDVITTADVEVGEEDFELTVFHREGEGLRIVMDTLGGKYQAVAELDLTVKQDAAMISTILGRPEGQSGGLIQEDAVREAVLQLLAHAWVDESTGAPLFLLRQRLVTRSSLRHINPRHLAVAGPSMRAPVVCEATLIVDGVRCPRSQRLTFAPPPVVTGISPDCAPTSGGTFVTVRGMGFYPCARAVLRFFRVKEGASQAPGTTATLDVAGTFNADTGTITATLPPLQGDMLECAGRRMLVAVSLDGGAVFGVPTAPAPVPTPSASVKTVSSTKEKDGEKGKAKGSARSGYKSKSGSRKASKARSNSSTSTPTRKSTADASCEAKAPTASPPPSLCFYLTPRLAFVKPDDSCISGGSRITAHGSGFVVSKFARARFVQVHDNGAPVDNPTTLGLPATVTDTRTLVITTPAVSKQCNMRLEIAFDGQHYNCAGPPQFVTFWRSFKDPRRKALLLAIKPAKAASRQEAIKYRAHLEERITTLQQKEQPEEIVEAKEEVSAKPPSKAKGKSTATKAKGGASKTTATRGVGKAHRVTAKAARTAPVARATTPAQGVKRTKPPSMKKVTAVKHVPSHKQRAMRVVTTPKVGAQRVTVHKTPKPQPPPASKKPEPPAKPQPASKPQPPAEPQASAQSPAKSPSKTEVPASSTSATPPQKAPKKEEARAEPHKTPPETTPPVAPVSVAVKSGANPTNPTNRKASMDFDLLGGDVMTELQGLGNAEVPPPLKSTPVSVSVATSSKQDDLAAVQVDTVVADAEDGADNDGDSDADNDEVQKPKGTLSRHSAARGGVGTPPHPKSFHTHTVEPGPVKHVPGRLIRAPAHPPPPSSTPPDLTPRAAAAAAAVGRKPGVLHTTPKHLKRSVQKKRAAAAAAAAPGGRGRMESKTKPNGTRRRSRSKTKRPRRRSSTSKPVAAQGAGHTETVLQSSVKKPVRKRRRSRTRRSSTEDSAAVAQVPTAVIHGIMLPSTNAKRTTAAAAGKPTHWSMSAQPVRAKPAPMTKSGASPSDRRRERTRRRSRSNNKGRGRRERDASPSPSRSPARNSRFPGLGNSKSVPGLRPAEHRGAHHQPSHSAVDEAGALHVDHSRHHRKQQERMDQLAAQLKAVRKAHREEKGPLRGEDGSLVLPTLARALSHESLTGGLGVATSPNAKSPGVQVASSPRHGGPRRVKRRGRQQYARQLAHTFEAYGCLPKTPAQKKRGPNQDSTKSLPVLVDEPRPPRKRGTKKKRRRSAVRRKGW